MKEVLSIEQMKHLKELGLDTSDASMHWQFLPTADSIINGTDEIEKEPCLFVSQPNMEHEYPAYTLQDILDKLSCFIGNQVLTIQKLADSYTCLYMEPYTRSMINITESKEPIDAAYDMLCWCIENGYVKVGKEEK